MVSDDYLDRTNEMVHLTARRGRLIALVHVLVLEWRKVPDITKLNIGQRGALEMKAYMVASIIATVDVSEIFAGNADLMQSAVDFMRINSERKQEREQG